MANETTQTGPGTWLTRPVVAHRLQISVASVRRLEGRVLHPKKNSRGAWVFDAEEVDRIEATMAPRKLRRTIDEGEIAARAFELFRRHLDLAAIVIELRQPPRVIRGLFDEWRVSLTEGYVARQRERDQRTHERWRKSLHRK